MKNCKVCNQEFSIKSFPRITGGYRSPYCKKCKKAFTDKNNARIRNLKKANLW